MSEATTVRAPEVPGCEFFPPLDVGATVPEVLGVPWDRQVEAAAAWQAAGGNSDSELQWAVRAAGVTIVPALERTGEAARAAGQAEGEAPTMHTIMRMSTLMVSLRERLMQIQTEAANVAIAEMGRRKSGPGAGAETTEGVPPLPQLHEDHARRINELTRAWFDTVASAQAGMSALTGYLPAGAQPAGGSTPLVERRKRAVLIDFPDRRRVG